MATDVDTLSEVAAELAVRVRDCGPADNAEWLLDRLPDPGDWFRLAFVCAAAVPVDERSWRSLTAWVGEGRTMRPGHEERPRKGKAAALVADHRHLPATVIARRTGLDKSTVYRHLKRMGAGQPERTAA